MQQHVACPSINTYSGEGQIIFIKNGFFSKFYKIFIKLFKISEKV
jgi:hypothetical protein